MVNLAGRWILSGRVLRTTKDQKEFEFKYLNFVYEIEIKQDGDYILVRSFIEQSGRPEIGIAPGIIFIKDGLVHIKYADYDDNGIFEFKENKCDKTKDRAEFIGTYFESGFNSINPLQIPSAGKAILRRKDKFPY